MAFIEIHRSTALNAALKSAHPSTGIRAIFAGLMSAFETVQRRRKLRTMSPHLLRDIGLTEGDIAVLKSEAEFDQSIETGSLRLLR